MLLCLEREAEITQHRHVQLFFLFYWQMKSRPARRPTVTVWFRRPSVRLWHRPAPLASSTRSSSGPRSPRARHLSTRSMAGRPCLRPVPSPPSRRLCPLPNCRPSRRLCRPKCRSLTRPTCASTVRSTTPTTTRLPPAKCGPARLTGARDPPHPSTSLRTTIRTRILSPTRLSTRERSKILTITRPDKKWPFSFSRLVPSSLLVFMWIRFILFFCLHQS